MILGGIFFNFITYLTVIEIVAAHILLLAKEIIAVQTGKSIKELSNYLF